MLAIFSFSFVSCSDDEDTKDERNQYNFITLDENAWRYYDEECLGTLEYNDLLDAWVITSLEQTNIPLAGDDSKILLVIMNMKDEFKSYKGLPVTVKGEAIWKYSAKHKTYASEYHICEITVTYLESV